MDGELVVGSPAPELRGSVSGYNGFREETAAPLRRREGPGRDVVVVISFGEEWRIDGERFTSFAAGLHQRQVTTEHGGRSFAIQIDLAPPAAYALFQVPLHTLANRKIPLEDVFGGLGLAERLHDAGGWAARFELLDSILLNRLAAARQPSEGVRWAWRRLVETDGGVPIRALAEELGWSRKRIVARFREEVGLPPKAAARLLRFERARALTEQATDPDWTRIALEAGYYDQSHMINDFRVVTGRTPATFLQDTCAHRT